MRLKSLIGFLVILALIGLAGYLAWTQPEWMMGYVRAARLTVAGYGPAKTPQEAVDKFRAAIKDRDYYAASTYCTGDYAEQMRKASTPATKLGTAIDNLIHNMDQEGVKSDKVQFALKLLEPFPTTIKLAELNWKEGQTNATARLVEDTGRPLQLTVNDFNDWKVDMTFCRALVRDIPPEVRLLQEGSGDKKCWKFDFQVTPNLRNSVDNLKDKYQNYVRALDKLKYELKRDTATKADLERRLREELDEAK
jgi:hypothetical protein